MATNLYEVLEISPDATPEQIRKAYKKRALKTHPDRLPPTATAAEKTESEEQFRKVNNAYEVLVDEKKKKEYDLHGVWPPPEPADSFFPRRNGNRQGGHSRHHHHSSRSNTFPEPFRFPSFMFTDPFTLFDSIFGDNFEDFSRPSRFGHPRRSEQSWPEDPFERMRRAHMNMMSSVDPDFFVMGGGMGGFSSQGLLSGSSFPPLENRGFGNGQGQWTSESFMTSTINGVTQTVHKRRDSAGNEHVTRTYSDGREVHTINGIEQPSPLRGYLPSSAPADNMHVSPINNYRHNSHAAGIQANMVNSSRSDYIASNPPPYQGHTANYAPPPATADHRRRERRSSEHYPYYGEPNIDHQQREDGHHRRRWWGGN